MKHKPPLLQHRDLVAQAVAKKIDAEMMTLVHHNERMAKGCLTCGSAAHGRVCPDCYVCISCPDACDECAGFKNPPPSHS